MSNPKIKAQELVDKYRGIAKYGQRQWGQINYAKHAALIAVDEILNIEGNYLIQTTFWLQVKEEIQKIKSK